MVMNFNEVYLLLQMINFSWFLNAMRLFDMDTKVKAYWCIYPQNNAMWYASCQHVNLKSDLQMMGLPFIHQDSGTA